MVMNNSGNPEGVGMSNGDLYAAGVVIPPSEIEKFIEGLRPYANDPHRKLPGGMIGLVLDPSKICTVNGVYRMGCEYKIKKFIGKGSSGDVQESFDCTKLTKCARKSRQRKNFKIKEVMALYSLSGTGVSPELYAVIFDEHNVFIFMEMIGNGKVLTDIMNGDFRREEQKNLFLQHRPELAWCLLQELVQVISVILEKGWIHSDVYGDNIMVQVKEDGSVFCRFVDFGSARQCLDQEDFILEREDYLQLAVAAVNLLCENTLDDAPSNFKLGWEDKLPKVLKEIFQNQHPEDKVQERTQKTPITQSTVDGVTYPGVHIDVTENFPSVSSVLMGQDTPSCIIAVECQTDRILKRSKRIQALVRGKQIDFEYVEELIAALEEMVRKPVS